ncbi:hypothetical protein N9963_02680 [Crocinitomicaceae bacterium]|nr:hypothetical protein [Crocinitomicaceae bacterium]
MKTFFTRLTSNFNNWSTPSGQDGKCQSSNALRPLYEELNHFGWEEWLFEDYHGGRETCKGFLQAFNDKNKNIPSVEVIHLYTRICDGVKPRQYYVGYIKDVKILPLNQRAASEEIKRKRLNELNAVGIQNFPTNDSMWKKCYNIQFERKNVFLQKDHLQCEITLNRNQFRFALYDLNDHPNFLTEINKYL